MKRWVWIVTPIALVVGVIAAMIAGGASSGIRVYPVRGVIVRVEADSVIIRHEAIPDFMPAMIMPFNFPESGALESLEPGRAVAFDFHVGRKASWADNFREISLGDLSFETGTAGEGRTAGAGGPVLQVLLPGERLPAFELLDQDERRFTEADLIGSVTVLNFIFTRCPVPEYCPAASLRFSGLQAALTDRTDPLPVQLVSVTLDPDYDVPSVLKSYAGSYGADPEIWRFLTGPREDIVRLTQVLGVKREVIDGAIEHGLCTVLFDDDGRVERIWRGTRWRESEVLDNLDTIMRAENLDRSARVKAP